MKKFIIIICLFAGPTLFSSPEEFNRHFTEASRRAKFSVVNIIIYRESNTGGAYSLEKIANASGTIISADGFVITNYHVVTEGNYFQAVDIHGNKYDLVKMSDGAYYAGDLKTDLALIRLFNPHGIKLIPIDFADSNKLKEGEWVLAIGNPYELKLSITGGIVSSKGRDNVGFADIEDFIQSDVSINPGNSGGPLINLYGEMVGINTAIRTASGGYQGISFAIPSNIAKRVSEDLIRHGRVRRGWLGFLARENKIKGNYEKSEVEIISVIKNSPAEHSGLKKGDLIMQVDETEITGLGRLINSIASRPVDSNIELLIRRGDSSRKIALRLMEKTGYRNFRRALDLLYSRYGIEIDENSGTDEIVISYLSPKSAPYSLERGDIIKAFNGKKILSLEDFAGRFIKNKGEILEIDVYRNSRLQKIVFQTGIQGQY